MGLWGWLKGDKEDKELASVSDTNEWIEVSFVVRCKTAKDVVKLATEMMNVLMNASAIYNSKGEYLGYTNPYLNKNTLLTYNKITEKLSFVGLTKKFFLADDKNDKKLVLKAEGLYSLPNLYKDMFILWNVSEDFLKLHIGGDGTISSFNTFFIKDKPAIECLEKLLKIRYNVEDRLNYVNRENRILDEKCLGIGVEDRFKLVKRGRFLNKDFKMSKDKQKETDKWVEEVGKLLGNLRTTKKPSFLTLP